MEITRHMSCELFRAMLREDKKDWCRGRELNPHGREAQGILSPPRLPVPPPRHPRGE